MSGFSVHLYKGYHSPQLPTLLTSSLEKRELFIFCPPSLNDFSFVQLLPAGELVLHGEWTALEKQHLSEVPRQTPPYPQTPILGLFTSGTSSQGLKLVMYSMENIEASLAGVLSFFDVTRIKTVFCYPHPFHTFGLLLGYVNALIHRWNFVTLDGKYSSSFHQKWLETVSENTLTLGTPTHFIDLLKFVRETKSSPHPSYSCIVGGAPVPPSLWQNIHRQLLIHQPSVGYGCTEASPALTHLPPGVCPANDGHVGFAIPQVQMELAQDGFLFRGPNVCTAFIQNGVLEFPSEIFIRDQLQLHADGSFSFLGRSDLVLNRGGEKYLLEEIEAFLLKTLDLRVIALATPHPRLGHDLGLLIEEKKGYDPTMHGNILEALMTRYKARFDDRYFLKVASLPTNPSGKIHRREAQQIFHSQLHGGTV